MGRYVSPGLISTGGILAGALLMLGPTPGVSSLIPLIQPGYRTVVSKLPRGFKCAARTENHEPREEFQAEGIAKARTRRQGGACQVCEKQKEGELAAGTMQGPPTERHQGKRHETHSDTGRRRADGKVMAETERSPSSAKTLDVPELFVNLADLQLLVSLAGNES